MFDVAPTELLLIAAVALIVIGPKDLPSVMRAVGRWVGKARGVASHFRSGFDQMVRDAELEEMQKRWATENERIMREHPAPAETGSTPAPMIGDEPPAEDAPGVSVGVNTDAANDAPPPDAMPADEDRAAATARPLP